LGVWGAVGHYSIGTLAISQVTNPGLKAFPGSQRRPDTARPPAHGAEERRSDRQRLVPLAGVPDIVWKKRNSPYLDKTGKDVRVKGGRDTSGGAQSSGPEHAIHHCDADRPFKGQRDPPAGRTGRRQPADSGALERIFRHLPVQKSGPKSPGHTAIPSLAVL
jgi:hypothetical protein